MQHAYLAVNALENLHQDSRLNCQMQQGITLLIPAECSENQNVVFVQLKD